jgi:hypothetical protein
LSKDRGYLIAYSNIIPFRDPDATIEGAELKAAIKAYWKAAQAVAAESVAKAFSAAIRRSG